MTISAAEGRVRDLVSLVSVAEQFRDADPQGIVEQLGQQFATLDEIEWAVAEDELLAAGINRATVTALAARRHERHQYSRDVEPQGTHDRLPSGHPIDMILRENEAIRGLSSELSHAIQSLSVLDTPTLALAERLRRLSESLAETSKHYARVQNVLLPHLERRGLKSPTRTLWAYYSGVRSRLAALRALLAQPPAQVEQLRLALEPVAAALLKSLHAGIAREERVVAPLLLRLLTEQEWVAVWRNSQSCGSCLVEPGRDYPPADARQDSQGASEQSPDLIRFAAGELSARQLRGIFSALPFDLTFVDQDDAVRFFTVSPSRIFSRNSGVLGRKVQNCHPPSSVRLVNRILSDFRAGRRDVAEFWFNRRGAFIHVRYFAVRDDAGAYLGTLEVAQDLAPLRALQDEQRLLTDDAAECANAREDVSALAHRDPPADRPRAPHVTSIAPDAYPVREPHG